MSTFASSLSSGAFAARDAVRDATVRILTSTKVQILTSIKFQILTFASSLSSGAVAARDAVCDAHTDVCAAHTGPLTPPLSFGQGRWELTIERMT